MPGLEKALRPRFISITIPAVSRWPWLDFPSTGRYGELFQSKPVPQAAKIPPALAMLVQYAGSRSRASQNRVSWPRALKNPMQGFLGQTW